MPGNKTAQGLKKELETTPVSDDSRRFGDSSPKTDVARTGKGAKAPSPASHSNSAQGTDRGVEKIWCWSCRKHHLINPDKPFGRQLPGHMIRISAKGNITVSFMTVEAVEEAAYNV